MKLITILTLDGLLFQTRQQNQSLSRYTQQEDRTALFSLILSFGNSNCSVDTGIHSMLVCVGLLSLSLL